MFPSSLLRGSVFYTCNEIFISPSPHQPGKLCECYLVGHGALFQHSHRALRNNSALDYDRMLFVVWVCLRRRACDPVNDHKLRRCFLVRNGRRDCAEIRIFASHFFCKLGFLFVRERTMSFCDSVADHNFPFDTPRINRIRHYFGFRGNWRDNMDL